MNDIQAALATALIGAAFGCGMAGAGGEMHRGLQATGAAVPDGAAIERMTGAKGKANAKEGVFKVSMPRTDLAVSVGGVSLPVPMGLACWAAFTRDGARSMVMGDLVLTEAQVDPAMDAALGGGLEVTALHNHFAFDTPRVMFMHIGGIGDETALATAVGKVFSAIKASAGASAPAFQAASSNISAGPLDAVFGSKAETTSGVAKYTFGRPAEMHGFKLGAAMGVNSWAAFGGTDDRAVVDGDVAVHEDELQGVLKALRAGGISVVAIHSHMTMEEPRTLFLHYWGHGPAAALAHTLVAAIPAER